MTTPSAAAGAYASLQRLANPSANLGRALGESSGGPSFGELLRSAATNLMDAGRRTDAQTHAMATGKGEDYWAMHCRWGAVSLRHETSNTMDPARIFSRLKDGAAALRRWSSRGLSRSSTCS